MKTALGRQQMRRSEKQREKAAKQSTSIPGTNFAGDYRSALQQYLARPDEVALGRAYELGRAALAQGTSLMEIAVTHHDALNELVFAAPNTGSEAKQYTPQAGRDFLAETLSPYEMAHRGFQEAIRTLRQMNDRLEEQIKGIAYAVHDEAGQLLVAVHLALASLANELPSAQRPQIVEIEGLLNEVEKHLRQYSHELRPTILDDLGWAPAVRFLAESVSKRTKIAIHVDAKITERLPSPVETAIYRVVQEALNNATKHSAAKNIWISAKKEDGALWCTIVDDGVGFDVQALRGAGRQRGLGLTGMQERLNAVGGTLGVESAPGKGTELRIKLTLENADASANRTR